MLSVAIVIHDATGRVLFAVVPDSSTAYRNAVDSALAVTAHDSRDATGNDNDDAAADANV